MSLPMHAYVQGAHIRKLLGFTYTCDMYLYFLARHKNLVQTLLDKGFSYSLICAKLKKFQSHHSSVQHNSHSVTQLLPKGVNS